MDGRGQITQVELLTVTQVAVLLGCCEKHVMDLVREGGFPHPVTFDGRKRWSRSDLKLWISAGCPAVGKPEVKEVKDGGSGS